jgi:2-hydroxychromene-2-carboxylate isomerase
MSAKTVEFWFDVGSPAAYIAWTQMPALVERTGARLVERPFLLGGVFHATGNRSPTEVPAKGRYMLDDLQRCATRYGVPFRNNPHFPINTLTLMRMIAGMQLREPDRMRPLADALFRAIWVDERNMNDPATAGEVLQQAGFDTEQLLALAADPAVKEQLKTVTQEAVARGVFGAPTFFVGDTMYWGQDRLDFVQEALEP